MILQPGYFDHWKTRMLVTCLGGDELAVICPLRLWEHCQVSGKWEFEDLSPMKLKAICRYAGDGNLLQAMLDSGFIDLGDDGLMAVHDWYEHNLGLFTSRKNGARGGRPAGSKNKQKHNPRDTHGIPTGNPRETHGIPAANPQGTCGEPAGNLNKTDGVDGVEGVDGVDGDTASSSAYAGWISDFRAAHDQCRDVEDYAIADAIRTALNENPNCDVDEAISAFARAWCGATFSNFVTPMKEFPKFLRGRNPNYKKNGGPVRADDGYDPNKVAVSPRKRRAALAAGAR